MDIYIMQDDQQLRIPILPSSYELESGADNQTETVITLGEVNLIGKRTLKTVSVSSIFPAQGYWFCNYQTFPKPNECVDMVEKMKNDGYVQLIVTGSKKINILCTIETFSWGEDDGTGDINYTIEFKEYRKVSNNGSSRPAKKKAKTIYTVKKGDTLQKISKKTTGTTKNWKTIKKKNKLKSNKLKVGQKLVIKI